MNKIINVELGEEKDALSWIRKPTNKQERMKLEKSPLGNSNNSNRFRQNTKWMLKPVDTTLRVTDSLLSVSPPRCIDYKEGNKTVK